MTLQDDLADLKAEYDRLIAEQTAWQAEVAALSQQFLRKNSTGDQILAGLIAAGEKVAEIAAKLDADGESWKSDA